MLVSDFLAAKCKKPRTMLTLHCCTLALVLTATVSDYLATKCNKPKSSARCTLALVFTACGKFIIEYQDINKNLRNQEYSRFNKKLRNQEHYTSITVKTRTNKTK